MKNKASPSKEIKCPHCGRLTLYGPENPARPFCSERCRLIDLGAWADESYRVPSTHTDFLPENDPNNENEHEE